MFGVFLVVFAIYFRKFAILKGVSFSFCLGSLTMLDPSIPILEAICKAVPGAVVEVPEALEGFGK